jgi:hypothetical protein
MDTNGSWKGRVLLEYLGVDGRVVFRWVLKGVRLEIGFMRLRIGPSGCLTAVIKRRKYLDQ